MREVSYLDDYIYLLKYGLDLLFSSKKFNLSKKNWY